MGKAVDGRQAFAGNVRQIGGRIIYDAAVDDFRPVGIAGACGNAGILFLAGTGQNVRMSGKKTLTLERVIETAAQMFAERRFDDVSVNDVAVAAHCSTATIYEIYETKENLFLNAIDHYLRRWTPPKPTGGPDDLAFVELLTYAEARIRFLAHPTTRGITRALGERYEKAYRFVRRSLEDQATFEAAFHLVETCMGRGVMSSGDAECVTYSVLAGVSFEPIAAGVMYGIDAPVAVGQILRKAFTPHLTDVGARQLRAYLQRDDLEEGAVDATAFLPLSLTPAHPS